MCIKEANLCLEFFIVAYHVFDNLMGCSKPEPFYRLDIFNYVMLVEKMSCVNLIKVEKPNIYGPG